MGRSRARKSCYEDLRRYNALDDELQVCEAQIDLGEAPPVPEEGLNAGIDPIMMRINEILAEMNSIENRILLKDSVYVNQVGDMDALSKISAKKGQYSGIVKARPADASTKSYFRYKMEKGNFNSDMF